MVKKKNVYEEWKEFAEIVDDHFWKGKFNKCSRGRFQSGYRYDGGILIYSDKNKSDSINVLDLKRENIYNALDEIIDMFHRNSNTYSPLEQKKLDELAIMNRNVCAQTVFKEWSSLLKSWKTLLLSKYVGFLLKHFKIKTNHKTLYDFLEMCIEKGCKVVLENNEIVELENLYWDDENKRFIPFFFLDVEKEDLCGHVNITFKKSNNNQVNKLTPYQNKFYKFYMVSH